MKKIGGDGGDKIKRARRRAFLGMAGMYPFYSILKTLFNHTPYQFVI